MMTLKNFSVADGAGGYMSKTTPRATLCIPINGGEESHEEEIQVDVYSMKRMGDNQDLMDLSFEYSPPRKNTKDLPTLKKTQKFFLVDRNKKTGREIEIKNIIALWTRTGD